MHFNEHGVFEVSVEGRLLIVDAEGPFNEELISKYRKALEQCISNLQKYSNWAQIIVMHNMSLFTPAAAQALIDSIKERKSKGLSACAVVLITPEGRNMIEEQMTKIYHSVGIRSEFWDSVDNAKKRLSTL